MDERATLEKAIPLSAFRPRSALRRSFWEGCPRRRFLRLSPVFAAFAGSFAAFWERISLDFHFCSSGFSESNVVFVDGSTAFRFFVTMWERIFGL